MPITSSLGKRMRALLMLAGVIPVAASAQSELPPCSTSEELSNHASARTEIFRYESGPELHHRFSVLLHPHAYQNSDGDAQLELKRGAAIRINYAWHDGALVPMNADVSVPFSKGENERKVYGLTLKLSGKSFDTQYDSRESKIAQTTIYRIEDAGLLETLDSDIELYFFELTGNKGTAAFGYRRDEALRAYRRANVQLQFVNTALKNRECRIQTYAVCFLTSATCELVGLADDCWELRTLRRFRDGWLARQGGGLADIGTYYEVAPEIADRLRERPKQLLKLYWTRIVPSAIAAKIGANRIARRIYTRMMCELIGSAG